MVNWSVLLSQYSSSSPTKTWTAILQEQPITITDSKNLYRLSHGINYI